MKLHFVMMVMLCFVLVIIERDRQM